MRLVSSATIFLSSLFSFSRAWIPAEDVDEDVGIPAGDKERLMCERACAIWSLSAALLFLVGTVAAVAQATALPATNLW